MTRTLGACFTTASVLEQAVFRAAHARAQSAAAPATLFEIEKAAEGVYLALAKPAAMLNCNAAVFVNARDILVVDAHSKPSAAAALVAQIRREVSPKPVRYIVNTHFHWDHVQGTGAYRKIAPQAQVVASQATRALIAEHTAKRLHSSLESIRRSLEDMRQKLGTARGEAERIYFRRMVSETRAYLREMENYQPELPDVTFGESLTVHDKAHDLHLVFRGRAHTASDISVFCPQKKAIATGDLLHGFIPGMGDGYPQEWSRTLARLGELDFTHVLPGHGGMQQGRDRMRQLIGYLDEINARVAAGKRAGHTVADLQNRITLASLKSLELDSYGGYVAATLEKYTLRAPGVSGIDAMAERVKANVADIFRLAP
ncbi:MAG: MBL fold metallo-hydrolase [Bryobacteraceae bacterium]